MIIYLINCTLHYNHHVDISFTGYGKDDGMYVYVPVTKICLKERQGGEIYIPETVKNSEGSEIFRIAIGQLVSITYMGD
tara:strand:- start:253 stop:489 length:237 start_codon:yes stop_codon:yes gene_type:complete